MGGFSIWHWILVLVIVILVFGTKKLKSMGGDIGEAVKNFKNALGDKIEDIDSTEVDRAKLGKSESDKTTSK
jgi:sec-independent protein translocase protein TatA